MADTREPSPRSRRTNQGSKIPSKKTQAEIDAAKEGAKKARKIIEERGNVKLNPPTELKIQGDRDLTVQQGINRDKERYGPTDELIRQGKLKEVWDKHPDNPKNKNINRFKQLLMIGAGGAAIVSKGLKSLLINPLGGAM